MVKTLLDLSVYISDETERRDKPADYWPGATRWSAGRLCFVGGLL